MLECIRTRLGRLKREVFLALLPNHATSISVIQLIHVLRALTAEVVNACRELLQHLQRMVMTRAAMNGLQRAASSASNIELRLSLERVCALYL